VPAAANHSHVATLVRPSLRSRRTRMRIVTRWRIVGEGSLSVVSRAAKFYLMQHAIARDRDHLHLRCKQLYAAKKTPDLFSSLTSGSSEFFDNTSFEFFDRTRLYCYCSSWPEDAPLDCHQGKKNMLSATSKLPLGRTVQTRPRYRMSQNKTQ